MHRGPLLVLAAACLASTPALAEEPSAKERFKACSASYDQAKPLIDKWNADVRKVIEETKDQPFYPAYSKLQNAYVMLFQEGRKEQEKSKDDMLITYSRSGGPAATLLLAVADLQMRTGYTHNMPVDLSINAFARAVETTGDDAFDRAVFCGIKVWRGPRDAYWLEGKERDAHFARANELMEKTLARYEALRQRVIANQRPRLGDVARVKAIKKNADGTFLLDVRRIDGSYTCVHTGNWRWAGTLWTDCDYKATPSKETDKIAVTFKDLPPGLKAGDEIMFMGNVPAGVEVDRMNGRPIGKKAAYDGLVISEVSRKSGVQMDICTDRPFADCASRR